MISNIIVVSLLSAFCLILAKKWGYVERMQISKNEILSELAHCDFCLSFWMCWIVSLVGLAITRDLSFLAIPFCSTPITRCIL